MAAVGNLTDQLLTLHLENSEGKTAPFEDVEIPAYKTHVYVCTAMRLNGKVHLQYAVGEVAICTEVASLEFNVSESPPEEMSDFLKPVTEDLPTIDDFASDQTVLTYYRHSDPSSELEKQVTTIIVNIHYPYSLSIKSSVTTLKIGVLCEKMFINMKPERSSANAHCGFKHWTVDSILLRGKEKNVSLREK
jgi:hypothetical protein